MINRTERPTNHGLVTPRADSNSWEGSIDEPNLRKLQWICKQLPIAPSVYYEAKSARTVIEDWRRHYNLDRPHSSLGYLSPFEFKKRLQEKDHPLPIQPISQPGAIPFQY